MAPAAFCSLAWKFRVEVVAAVATGWDGRKCRSNPFGDTGEAVTTTNRVRTIANTLNTGCLRVLANSTLF